jgi:hypothetical protein
MVYHDRSLIGPPLLDDDVSSTIEHDIMRHVREWMAGGRVPLGTSRRCTAHDRPRSLGGYQDMPTPEFVDPGANVRSHFPARCSPNPFATRKRDESRATSGARDPHVDDQQLVREEALGHV